MGGFHSLPTVPGYRPKARFPHSHRRDGYAVASPLEPKGTKPAPQTVKRRRFALGGLTHTKPSGVTQIRPMMVT